MNQVFLGYGVAVVAGELTTTVGVYSISAPKPIVSVLILV